VIRAPSANALHGAEHIAGLERALAVLDPASRQARSLRAHVAFDRATASMKLRQLAVPYQRYEIKLEKVGNDLRRPTGVGVRVKLNTRTSLLLLLDTGASGISITPKTAERAGLEQLTTESTEASGFGDDQAQDSKNR